MRKQTKITVGLVVLLFLLTIYLVPSARMAVEAGLFDLLEGNTYVEKEEHAQRILAKFATVSMQQLPDTYRKINGLDEEPFRRCVKTSCSMC